ncbi:MULTISPECIES: hypothetical protein [Flavobacterium]|uniref:DUF3592 domain-containing protein n=1 Tax=Flavobacterium lipolyticum TaxID=2893754 RepID=A0ABS8M098_9FLAO|nr:MULTISPECIES: hypothetical protein [unclassified Flavobacterium]MCC9018269.1 hypothetical protein [Flavobacterium sp. F-126]
MADLSEWGKIIVPLTIIGVLFFSIRNSNIENEKFKKRLTEETIGLSTRIEYHNKTRGLKYYFYVNKKIISECSLRSEDYDKDLSGKFYKIKYNPNNPEENELILDGELLPDSLSLVKAGFVKTKYYIYDAGVTCKYIEKSKWK